MGEWAAAELPKPDYSRQSDNRVGLTDAGNALAADLGLLVADTLFSVGYWPLAALHVIVFLVD